MEVLKFQEHKNICDEVRFQLKGDILEYIDFFFQEKPVLMEFKNTFTGMDIETFRAKSAYATSNPNLLILFRLLVTRMKELKQNNDVKLKIFDLKNKT